MFERIDFDLAHMMYHLYSNVPYQAFCVARRGMCRGRYSAIVVAVASMIAEQETLQLFAYLRLVSNGYLLTGSFAFGVALYRRYFPSA